MPKRRKTDKALLLSADEAGELLGVGRDRVYRLRDAGAMPAPVRLPGMQVDRYRKDELLAWIAAGAPDLSVEGWQWEPAIVPMLDEQIERKRAEVRSLNLKIAKLSDQVAEQRELIDRAIAARQ